MLKYNDKPVTLKLTREQFLVIYEFLYHTKLGERNVFEEAVSDLMIEMEDMGVEDLVNEFRDVYGEVEIQVHLSEEDGISLQVEEKE